MSTTTVVSLSDDTLDEIWRVACEEPKGTMGQVRLLRELRVMPGRRATLLGSWDGSAVVVKVFASPRARGNDRRLRSMDHAGLAGLVPRALAVSGSGHVGVVSFEGGSMLDAVDDEEFVSASRQAGRALGVLHRSGAGLDRAWTHDDEVAQLLRRAPQGTVAACRDVAAEPVEQAAALVPSHRDFHPRQVVVADDAVHLIDLDDAALAPAGLDVGNMVAHLRREAVVGRRSLPVAERSIAEFLAGYGEPPVDLAVWERLSLARLAGLAETRHGRADERDELLVLLPDPADPHPAESPVTGADPMTAEHGHADRPVRFLKDERGPLVVKRYRGGAGAAVFEAMDDLWHSPFGRDRSPGPGLPRPLAFDPHTGELTMSRAAGEALASRGELGGSLTSAQPVAALLADLQASGIGVARLRSRSRLLRSAARKAADRRDDAVGAAFAHTLEHLASASAMVPESGDLVPTHGDFSPRNLLAGPDGLALIDFDRIQLASPLRDVAYWTAWLWVTATRPELADPLTDEDGWRLGEEFVGCWSDRAERPLAESLLRELDLHRALSLVRITHGWSALAQRPDQVTSILGTARDLATVAASPRWVRG